jgi:hypothetical protein
MARELTSAVPLDDEPIENEAVETADKEDSAEDGTEGEATEAVEAKPEASGDLSAEDLEALVDDEKPRGIPKSRFDEVNNERRAFAEQNALLARALAEREQKAAPAPTETAKPRDFESERTTLKEKYESGDLDVASYLAEVRKVDRAEDRAELDQKLQPVVKSLEQEREQIQNDRTTLRLQAEAEKVFTKYPFLNHADEENANVEAINKVLAQRDELIAAKIDPVKALRLAVAAVAPEYAPAATAPKVDDVAAARRIAAQKKAAAASTQQPAALRGTSDRVVDTSEHISGSVKDHETWEARQRAQSK